MYKSHQKQQKQQYICMYVGICSALKGKIITTNSNNAPPSALYMFLLFFAIFMVFFQEDKVMYSRVACS